MPLLGWGSAWGIYLFLLNERPRLTGILALLLLIQGGVAVMQFWQQGDLGLRVLGEYSLDPTVEGVSVLWARDHPWLRAYGLTGHPNMLGALLASLLLLLLPELSRGQGWPQRGIALALSVGFLGLLVSFSRAAWLGFAGGVLVGLGRTSRWTLLPFLLGLLCLIPYRDLAGSRWAERDSRIEQRSMMERLRDVSLAIEIIQQHPWAGVGVGRYLEVARARQPEALIVHNVPLLVGAELGFLGLACWLWLMRAGFLALSGREPPVGPWLSLLVIGLFDITLWPTTGIRNALLFALLAAPLAIHLEESALGNEG
ncbi:MAG: O-antigen ligase family protein [Ardenticatenales bacterium]|nr:O-antigen ligase family protein [Ardenticatenales bacterium]